jgi:hypothetical protein
MMRPSSTAWRWPRPSPPQQLLRLPRARATGSRWSRPPPEPRQRQRQAPRQQVARRQVARQSPAEVRARRRQVSIQEARPATQAVVAAANRLLCPRATANRPAAAAWATQPRTRQARQPAAAAAGPRVLSHSWLGCKVPCKLVGGSARVPRKICQEKKRNGGKKTANIFPSQWMSSPRMQPGTPLAERAARLANAAAQVGRTK